MKTIASPAGRRPAIGLCLGLAAAAAVLLAIALAAVLRIDAAAGQFRDDIGASAARTALAEKADEAFRGALSNEKNAMAMTGKAGLDEYAGGWMTSMDHLKALLASLQLLSDPSDQPRFDEIQAAVERYAALGVEMYQLKLGQESRDAVAISTGAADAARNRLDALIQREVAGNAAALAGRTRRFRHETARIAASFVLALAAAFAATALAARTVRSG